MNRDCNDCGESDWRELLSKEKGGRGDSDPVKVTVYKCRNCGAEGRRFDEGGSTTFSGALR